MKKITMLLVYALVLTGMEAYSQNARVQVIHNSADAAAAEVDVYLDGTLLLDNFAFRTATPFIDAPANTEIEIVVAPATSSSASDGIYTLQTTLMADETYILVANGIVSETGYAPNQPFQLSVFAGARETASNPANVDMLVNHGATDAPPVDVVETSVPVGVVIDDIAYPQFSDDYLELVPGDYVIDITTASGDAIVESYLAPLQTLGLQGGAITVIASGFLDPSENNDGPAFGLWVALASGGDLVQLPLANPMARVQVIHNAADLAAAEVDVYLNGSILLDDFAFRTATPFIDAPAGTPIEIVIAPGNSESVEDGIFTLETELEADGTYIIVANGIVSGEGYEPNQPFDLYVYPMGREMATMAGNTDVLVFHGATDAPTVDVQAVGAGTIVDDISYGEFNDYLELPVSDYVLSVTTSDGTTVVASYEAPLATLGLSDSAITVLASGFLDPSLNSDGAAFGLWVALPQGGELIALPMTQLSTPDFSTKGIKVYPNPSNANVTIDIPYGYNSISSSLYDMTGRQVLTTNGQNNINVSGLTDGVYLLNTTIDGSAFQQRIIVRN